MKNSLHNTELNPAVARRRRRRRFGEHFLTETHRLDYTTRNATLSKRFINGMSTSITKSTVVFLRTNRIGESSNENLSTFLLQVSGDRIDLAHLPIADLETIELEIHMFELPCRSIEIVEALITGRKVAAIEIAVAPTSTVTALAI